MKTVEQYIQEMDKTYERAEAILNDPTAAIAEGPLTAPKMAETPRQRFYLARAGLDAAIAIERRAESRAADERAQKDARVSSRLTWAIVALTGVIAAATVAQAWIAARTSPTPVCTPPR